MNSFQEHRTIRENTIESIRCRSTARCACTKNCVRANFARCFTRQSATIEDIDFKTPRGLDRALISKLATGGWIKAHQNLIITGPCGVGKSWLACALGNKACRDDHSVLYRRATRLFQELALARGDGRYPKLLKEIAHPFQQGWPIFTSSTTGDRNRSRPAIL